MATKDYASPAQARLMRAVAHGWKKPGGGGPSRAVAEEFVEAKDRARGGLMNYAEGGTARADNPYPKGTARWRLWERKHGRDPDAKEKPKAAAPPAKKKEEEGMLSGLFGRSKRELEEMEQAEGGPVGYQFGGLAAAVRRFAPQIQQARQRAQRRHVLPADGKSIRGGNVRTTPPRPPVHPGVTLGPNMNRFRTGLGAGEEESGMVGGPRVPPNLRGHLQRMRMMNRPRMGPSGGQRNRVGQQDQQGALARALQRGTGRAPMSRRRGFYR